MVFTGVSGSGKSSLAFGTLYAEAQRRYLESVSPYARRLFHQMAVPEVDEIDGLPPAVALQQQRGSPTTRSSVGSVTTLSNLLRMLYSRAGDYPPNQPLLYAESFSPNTPEGACPECHGLGRVYEVTERSMVPDDSLTIRERADRRLADRLAGPEPARHPDDARLRRRSSVARTAEEGSRLDPLHRRAAGRAGLRGLDAEEVRRRVKRKEEPSYQGTFTSARRHVLHTFATTQSALMKKRVSQYMLSTECPLCHGKRLRRESLSVKFAGFDIAEISRLPLTRLADILRPLCGRDAPTDWRSWRRSIRRRRWSSSGSPRISRPARGAARSRARLSVAGARARRRFRRANCSGCGWPPRCAPICSAWSMCSTSRRPGCIPRTPRRCCGRSTG